MGPGDADWVAIENHPQLADVAADLEPPPPRTYDDETRLDMNALIDVCLVLLIFFMLITTYSVLQKRMEQPPVREQDLDKMKTYKMDDPKVQEQMLLVKVRMENGQPVIRLEDKVVAPDDLIAAFNRAVAGSPKNQLLLDAGDDVPHGVVVAVQDAASGARLNKVHLVMPPKNEPAKAAK